MFQDRDFHFCLLISQQGLCVPLSFPNLTMLYRYIYIKEHKKNKKNLQSSDQIPRSLVLTPREKKTKNPGSPHYASSPSFIIPSFCLSDLGIYLPGLAGEGPHPEAAWPRCNGGENAIVPCSCFARGTKNTLSLSLLNLRLCSGPAASPNGRLAKNKKIQNRRGGESK